ncbi:MAG: Peptidase, family, partial [Pedosphaera sp.]|nr:Peptidase, family [Pedosphaera sp.]
SEGPAATPREAAWLIVFGITSGIYRVIIFAGVLLLVADRFLILGLIMAAVCLISWVTVPIGKFIYYLAASPRLQRVRWRATAITAGLAALALLLLAVVPFPHHFRAPGIVQAERRTEVVVQVSGVVEKILATPGSKVSAGQPLLQLSSRELELDLTDARARMGEVEARLRAALTRTNADLKPLASRLESVTNRLAKLNADLAALTVRAAHDGIWVAPRVRDVVGRRLERGVALGLVVDPGAFEFVATVAQTDADAIFARPLSRGEVRLRGQAGEMMPVSHWNIVPGGQLMLPSPALGWVAGGEVPVAPNEPGKAKELFFEVHARLPDHAEAVLLHGSSGSIRFDLEPEPLLPRWMRQLGQLLQKRYQL